MKKKDLANIVFKYINVDKIDGPIALSNKQVEIISNSKFLEELHKDQLTNFLKKFGSDVEGKSKSKLIEEKYDFFKCAKNLSRICKI